jgi:hypothetical protein
LRGNPLRSTLSSQIAKGHVELISCSEFIWAYYLEAKDLTGFIRKPSKQKLGGMTQCRHNQEE